jgi:signal transduction histidine kinase
MAKGAATRCSFTGNSHVTFRPKLDPARMLAWTRAILAAATLALGLLHLPHSGPFPWAMGAYLIYAAVVAMRHAPWQGLPGLLALIGDTIYFLALAGIAAESLPWLATVFWLFLLTEALVFRDAVEVAIVSGTAAVFCALVPQPAALQDLERTVVVGGALACVLAVHARRRTAEQRRLEEELEAAHGAARKATDLERVRIGNDFHDGPLQSFISLQMRLEILRKLLDRDFEAGMQDLKQLQALAQSQVRDLRAFIHSMRPADVDGGNLIAAIRRIAEMFQKESGIPVTFAAPSKPVGMPQEMTKELLAMVREALHNVQKHAAATRVALTVERTDRGLEVSFDDNGHGFSFAGTYSLEELDLLRLGPASLKGRARAMNADLQLESRPGRGSGLKVKIPL